MNSQTTLGLGTSLFLNILSHSLLIHEHGFWLFAVDIKGHGIVLIEHVYSYMMLCFVSLILLIFSSVNGWIPLELGLVLICCIEGLLIIPSCISF